MTKLLSRLSRLLRLLSRLTRLWSRLAPAAYLAWNPHPWAVASGPGMKERWRVFPKEKKADDGSWSWQKFTDLKISALRFCFDPWAQIYSCNLSEPFFIWGKSCVCCLFRVLSFCYKRCKFRGGAVVGRRDENSPTCWIMHCQEVWRAAQILNCWKMSKAKTNR